MTSVKVRRVGGAQAKMGAEIGLVKVTRASAKLAFDANMRVILIIANAFGSHLEPELGRRTAFFVYREELTA